MLEVNNLSVKYKGSAEWTLDDISFTVNEDEFVIVAGSSGSGKSTLAKTILRIIPFFEDGNVEGYIGINGRNIDTISRERAISTVGFLPQYPADFVTTMIVDEEIAFPLENLGFSKDEISRRIDDVLAYFGIDDLRHRLTTELSSGELQKVTLASVLAVSPPLIILDEPMARIDSTSEITLVNKINELKQEGHAILAFEHRLDHLLPIADRVVLLDRGKVLTEGKPEAIIEDLIGIDLPDVSKIDIFQERVLDIETAVGLVSDYIKENSRR